MTGPEHYREAERLLAQTDGIPEAIAAARPNASGQVAIDIVANVIATAQAHATLALVAATAEQSRPGVDGFDSLADSYEWAGVVR